MTKTISFIGTGKMASALISSIYKNNLAKSIIASDKYEQNLKNIKAKFRNVKTTNSNAEAVKSADIVFLCVKPQDMDILLNEIKHTITNQLIVSIAAGVKLKHYESILKNKRIIRVMPNVNCLVGEMASGFVKGKNATKSDVDEVKKLLSAAGITFQLKENQIDALIGVSGSGPAFFAYFIDAIAKQGIKEGLKKEVAYKLAAQTALGTGKLLIKNNILPEELIAMVASKGGTTVAGLKVLDKLKTKEILAKTVNAAAKRSREMGK